MNKLTVQIFKRLMDPCLIFVHHEASFGRKTDRLDPLISYPGPVLIETEQVRARLDERHVSLADDCLPGVLVVVGVDDDLGHSRVLSESLVLVPAGHRQDDPPEAGLPLHGEHLVGGLELGVTLDHGPAQAVRRGDDVAPTMYKSSMLTKKQIQYIMFHSFSFGHCNCRSTQIKAFMGQ